MTSVLTSVPPLRVARVTAKVLLGDELPEEELLKTSGTKLETILKDEGLEVEERRAGEVRGPAAAGDDERAARCPRERSQSAGHSSRNR